MATINCVGKVCKTVSEIILLETNATEYQLERPANPDIKLKKPAIRKMKVSKSGLRDEFQKAFKKAATAFFQYDLGKGKKGTKKTTEMNKACDGKKCECKANPKPTPSEVTEVNYKWLHSASTGQSFTLFGTVKYRVDTQLSTCQLKKDAFFANFSELDLETELRNEFQISPGIQVGEAQPLLNLEGSSPIERWPGVDRREPYSVD